MSASQEAITILNDLIQINNDRITGYEHAIKELKNEDEDLKALFAVFIDESRKNKMALGTEVQALGADMNKGTTANGKIYRAWMDIKAVFTGHTRHVVLENCEFGEDAAHKAYNAALHDNALPAYIREMIASQQKTLQEAHDKIKSLRNQSA